jgi:hypothetical protein
MGLYNCPYILRNGEVCNRGCYRPEGCFIHYKSPERIPCEECGKLTFSKYKHCEEHAGKYRKREQYYRKKAEKLEVRTIQMFAT